MKTATDQPFTLRIMGNNRRKTIKVMVRPVSMKEARTIFPYRPLNKYAESRFGGDNLHDDICLLLNKRATRCRMCQAPTKNEFLQQGVCPDCDGRSEYNGIDPHSTFTRV